MKSIRVLAIDPTTRGIAFAVIESPTRLIDWGVKNVRENKNRLSIVKVIDLLNQYQPDVIVMEEPGGDGSRRCERVSRLLSQVRLLAANRQLGIRRYSRGDIRDVFAEKGATTKQEIANVLAHDFPELAKRLPRIRRPWMSEDYRMNMFDAVSLAATFLANQQHGT